MSQTNIAFFELEKWEEKYLSEQLAGFKKISLKFFNHPVSAKDFKTIKNTNILAVFIYSQINKQVLAALPDLKLITTMSTGFDHIDLKAAAAAGVTICNVPYYGENTVAEHTFALILALSRKLSQAFEKVRQYNFQPDGLRGFDLKDKTIGLIGLGHIGSHVARIAKGFGMKIIAYDLRKDLKLVKQYNLKYVSLPELLAKAHIISLHAPYNKSTHHLINKKNIKFIKPGAYLINTARGGLVETAALIEALNKNILAGAALDVLEEECAIKEEKELLSGEFQKKCDLKTIIRDHYLIRDPRVLVTPHNAFNSTEALQRILETTVDNIKAFLKNKPLNLIK